MHFFDVEKYREQLAKHYQRNMSSVRRTPWNPHDTVPIDDIYTRLSWVREGEELDDYIDLFKARTDGTKVKRILVEGDAGMGKSTFAKRLAVDWAKGRNQVLQQFEMVIVLKLREVCKAKTLEEAVEASEIFSIDDAPVFADFYEYVKTNQERVLFIFDGHDEYDYYDAKGSKETHITHITQMMERRRLENCCVLVTTRPWRADELKTHTDAQAKITGFSEEDVKAFCLKFFKDDKKAYMLYRYLDNHGLMDTAKVPLLLVFYCLLWQEGEELPEARTELYKATVECVLNHNKSKGRKRASETMEKYKESLCLIGKVAFEALMKDAVIFAYKDLPEEVTYDDILQLGFLSVTSTVCAHPEMKVSFLHKSIQEFLAAWYITECRPADFPDVLKTLENMERFYNLSVFLKFVCGLSAESSEQVFQRLQEITDTNKTLPPEPLPFFDLKKYLPDYLPLRLFQEAHPEAQLLRQLLCCTGGVLSFDEDTITLKRITQAIQMAPAEDKCMIKAICFSQVLNKNIEMIVKVMEALDVNVKVSSRSDDIRASDFVKTFMDITCRSENPCHLDSLCIYRSGNHLNLYAYKLTLSCDSHADLFVNHGALELESVSERDTASCPKSEPAKATFLSFTWPVCLQHLSEKTMEGLVKTLIDSRVGERDTPHVQLKNSVLTPDVATTLATRLGLTMKGFVSHGLLGGVSPICDETKCNEVEFSICQPDVLVTYTLGEVGAYLTFHSSDIPDTVLDASFRLLQMHPPRNLTISGQNNILTDGTLKVFMEVILNRGFLRDLTLSSLCFPTLHLRYLLRYVQERLESLSLAGDVRMNEENLPDNPHFSQLADPSHLFPHLEIANLGNTGTEETHMKLLAENDDGLPMLENLYFSGNPPKMSARLLAQHLCDVPNLRSVNLSNTGMGESEGKSLAENIQHVWLLQDLELSKNPLGKSTRLLAEHLCDVTELTSVDLSNTGMGEIEGKSFAENLQHVPLLNFLTLSGNPLGKSTRLLAEHLCDVTELMWVDLSNTGMGEIEGKSFAENLQHVPLLEFLNLSGNPLVKSTMLLAEHLCHVPKLARVHLSNTGMGEIEGKSFAENLQHVPLLHFLDLSGNPLGKSTRLFVEHLCHIKKYANFNLNNTGMGEIEGKSFAENLQHVPLLDWLVLSGNPLGKSTRLLAEHLCHVPKLYWVDLSNTGMGETEGKSFAENIQHVPLLTRLNLSGNPLGKSTRLLAEHLCHVPKLYWVDLSNTGMGETEGKSFAENIQHVPLLTRLNLSGNPLGKSTRLLAEHLCHVPKLERVDLSNTGMGETEGKSFAENIQHVPLLTRLNLSGNPLGKSTRLLAEHLCHVPKLEQVDLSNTGMGETEGKSFAENLQHVPLLEWLNFSGNPLRKSTSILAEHLCHVPRLEEVNLSNTGMGKIEGRSFAENLQHVPSLERLNLSGNLLGESSSLLAEHLFHAPKFCSVDLSNTGMGETEGTSFTETSNTCLC